MTKLEQFRVENGIQVADLVAASGLSRKSVELIRKGSNTTIDSAKAIASGLSKLLKRDVAVEEVFDLSVEKNRKRSAA